MLGFNEEYLPKVCIVKSYIKQTVSFYYVEVVRIAVSFIVVFNKASSLGALGCYFVINSTAYLTGCPQQNKQAKPFTFIWPAGGERVMEEELYVYYGPSGAP